MSPRTRRFLHAYRLALLAAPRDFRRRHAEELSRLVIERLEESFDGRGRGWWRQAVFEIGDVVGTGLSLRARAFRATAIGLPFAAAFRGIRRRPGFAALTVALLSLGLGVAMTIGATIDAVLVRPLPYADPSRLVMIWRTFPKPGIARGPASYPDYLDLRASSKVFSDIAAYGGVSLTFEDRNPERVTGLRASGNLFTLLGSKPALGRVLVPTDDRVDAEPTMVLGHSLWRRRFGADSSIIGRVLTFGERRFRVVGVMGEGFAFPNPGPQFWTPLRLDVSRTERDVNRFQLIGRLSPAATIADARRDIEQIALRIKADHPNVNPDAGVRLEARRDAVVAPIRSLLLLVGLGALVVLVMACVNVANLLLVRSVARQHDVAVRRALGASIGTLVRERLAESVLLGTSAWALATWIAIALTKFLLAAGVPLPRAAEIGVTPRVVGLALIVSIAAVALPALLPLLRVSRAADLGGERNVSGAVGARRIYAGFVAIQIALALAMFVTAGVLARSFYNLVTVPRGFDGSRILTGYVSLPTDRYASEENKLAFFNTLMTRAEALPGVESASATWALPFSDGFASSAIVAANRPTPKDAPPISIAPILPKFFRTLGVPFRNGRDFDMTDGAGAAPVAIVNEMLARRFWPGENAVGQQIRPADPSDGGPITVVGVVADMKRRGLNLPTEPEVYRPFAQALYSGDLYVTLRFATDPVAATPAFKRVVNELDPRLPVSLVGTLDALVDASIVGPRFRTTLIGVFAGLAGVMALIGVYGVLAFVVATRKREIAIRGALGASASRARPTSSRKRSSSRRRGSRLV